MRALLFALLVLVAGCSSKPGSPAGGIAVSSLDLPGNGGRWQSKQQLVKTIWTFQAENRYEALHQEGPVAAQVRGSYTLRDGELNLRPEYVNARSAKPEEAAAVKERLERGYRFRLRDVTAGTFLAEPVDGGETLQFEKS